MEVMSGMSVGLIWGILAVVVAGILIYLWKRKQAPKPVVRAISYRCVGIESPDPHAACSAVRAMAGHRFLAGQSPQIPVPGCSAPRCSCKFVHYEDRRAGDRRGTRGQQVRSLKSLDWAERRSPRGRRKADRAARMDEAAMQAALAEKRRRGR